MKRALYYSIRVKTLYPYVVAVTSEKGARLVKRWYGRRVEYDEPTNGTTDQLRGRFDTVEQAINMREQIADIAAEYDRKRALHHDAVLKLHRAESEAVNALFAGKGDG